MTCRPAHLFRRRLRQTTLLLNLALLASLVRAAEPALYLEGGLGVKQGNFGTSVTSRLGLAYGSLGYASDRFDVSLSVPYLRLQTSGGGQDVIESGLGDVLLRGARRLVPETEEGFSLDGVLAVKLPTADSNKGLGTGQTDVGGFLGLHQRWDRIQATLTGGWIQGSTGGNLAPVTTSSGAYAAGIGLTYIGERGRYSMGFQARGAQYVGLPAPREATLDLFRMVGARTALRGSVILGLNDGSPRTSFGLGVVYWPQ